MSPSFGEIGWFMGFNGLEFDCGKSRPEIVRSRWDAPLFGWRFHHSKPDRKFPVTGIILSYNRNAADPAANHGARPEARSYAPPSTTSASRISTRTTDQANQ